MRERSGTKRYEQRLENRQGNGTMEMSTTKLTKVGWKRLLYPLKESIVESLKLRTVEPHYTVNRSQRTTTFYLLLADFCYCKYVKKNEKHFHETQKLMSL